MKFQQNRQLKTFPTFLCFYSAFLLLLSHEMFVSEMQRNTNYNVLAISKFFIHFILHWLPLSRTINFQPHDILINSNLNPSSSACDTRTQLYHGAAISTQSTCHSGAHRCNSHLADPRLPFSDVVLRLLSCRTIRRKCVSAYRQHLNSNPRNQIMMGEIYV